ncbi:MAG: hypothetical protein JWN43_3112 [Gammaproteobacteria bacterium]|nr:hypothetical protein [Gammaproteobacteria bacterium]
MEDPTRESLDGLLAKLPRNVAPSRNLWPAIAAGVESKPRSFGPLAIAASLVVGCMAGALMWAVLHGRPPEHGDPAATAIRAVSFDEPRDPQYLAARADLVKSFRERLANLDPQTRAKIEASLALIRQAHEDIRRALVDEPANPVLERLLQSTWHDEFDLYDHVVQSTQPTMTRS